MQEINQEMIKEFLDKKNVFAVVGVSKESEICGNKIYSDLKHAGYTLYSVNPYAIKISGNRCYSNLNELPKLPDIIRCFVNKQAKENKYENEN